jgi:predicted secreted protein
MTLTTRERAVLDRLGDERSGRVVLVSHCLLDENVRYAGGAFRPGVVAEVVSELAGAGYGIHQMPCPERLAWGGARKRLILPMYGSKGSVRYALRGPLLRAFVWWTRLVYRRLARSVVRDIAEYRRSGIEVAAIVGVGASPSCGVATTLDLRRSLEVVASCPLAQLSREVVNEQAVLGCRQTGEGLFIRELQRELRRRHIEVPFLEHDLAAEMRGERQVLLPAG